MISQPPAAFHVLHSQTRQTPVVIGVPHAGRYYPPSVLARARVPQDALERLEDRHVDVFAASLGEAGHHVVVADIARAAIDLNRSIDEWEREDVAGHPPPTVINARTRSGLGVIPRRLSGIGDLWRHRLDYIEFARVVADVHRPYHAAIAEALNAARATFGWAVFLDLHSMPSAVGAGPQIVLGDRHGLTASLQLVDGIIAIAEGARIPVERNVPYAGAHGVMTHGAPRRSCDAVQVELDRALYLDAQNMPDLQGVARIEGLLIRMADWAARYARDMGRMAEAAE